MILELEGITSLLPEAGPPVAFFPEAIRAVLVPDEDDPDQRRFTALLPMGHDILGDPIAVVEVLLPEVLDMRERLLRGDAS